MSIVRPDESLDFKELGRIIGDDTDFDEGEDFQKHIGTKKDGDDRSIGDLLNVHYVSLLLESDKMLIDYK